MAKQKDMIKTETLREIVFGENSRTIRIGVAIADENAAKESKKRRLNAPLTTVEKVFLHVFK